MASQLVNKTERLYWDNLWERRELPSPVDPFKRGIRNYLERKFHQLFKIFLSHRIGQSLIEIGCAGSPWLPYFGKEFGFHVSGIDYSPIGCQQARRVLQLAGINGTVIEADLFSPTLDISETFDVVFSFGVAEHFSDTAHYIRACNRILKPGGLIITIIPNMAGWMGWMQKTFCREIYEIHVPLDRKALSNAHENAGMQVDFCNYFLFFSGGVINWGNFRANNRVAYLLLYGILYGLTGLCWTVEPYLPFLKANQFTSPYILCIAKKHKDD